MELKRIFYNINQRKLKKLNAQGKDIGIFFDKRKEFIGKQFLMKIVKPANYYNYEKIIQEFYKKNKELFMIENKDISFMCNKFLLRTYSSFGRNSIGNYMTLIDILDMIFKDMGKDKFIEFYIPAREKDIEYIIKEFFKKNEIKHFRITRIRQLAFSWNMPDTIIGKGALVRLFLRYLLKRKFKELNSDIPNLFIEPIDSKMDTFLEVKKTIKNYDILTFEVKNKIKTSSSIFDLIKYKQKPFIGEFYNFKHFIKLWKIHKRLIKKVKNTYLEGFTYKKIDLINPSKAILNSLFYGYYLLIIDSLILSEKICSRPKNIFFHYDDDPLLEFFSTNDNKLCKKYSIQYELIYPGCAYNILEKSKKLTTKYELVWNKYSKDVLVNYYGYSPEKVITIGNIRFSKILRKETPEKINLVLALPGNAYIEVLDFFLDVVRNVRNNNLQFYIKPHPGENIKTIKFKIKDSSVRLITDLNDALKTADILVSYISTVVYEAMYNNIPVIIINPYNFYPSGVPFYKYYPYFNNKEKFKTFLEGLNKGVVKKIEAPEELNINEFNERLFRDLISDDKTK